MKTSLQTTISVILCLSFVFCKNATAQEDAFVKQKPYISSIGIRLGNEYGITVKQFVNYNTAFEGILSKDKKFNATRITLLYEVQNKIKNIKNVCLYYGIGAHASFFRPNYNIAVKSNGYYDVIGKWHSLDYRVNYSSAGFDALIGLEYIFEKIPVAISLDAKPYLDFISMPGSLINGAISLKYIMR